MTENP